MMINPSVSSMSAAAKSTVAQNASIAAAASTTAAATSTPAPTTDSMTAGYEVGFVSNMIERLYKDSDHKITVAENASALASDSKVAALTKEVQAAGGLSDADAATAASTAKLYDKKTNWDKTVTSLFGNKDVTIADIRAKFGASVDTQILGGQSLEDVIKTRDALTAKGDTAGVKDINMFVHAQGSHEGDLVNADGTRILKTSALQYVDPVTGEVVETKDQAKTRSDAATTASNATPNNPTGKLVSQNAFQNELNKELQGQIDKTFINSEITGHKAKGDFIQNFLVNGKGATDLQAAADTNQGISTNATQFLADFGTIGSGGTFINRIDGSANLKQRAAKAASGDQSTGGSTGSNGSSGSNGSNGSNSGNAGNSGGPRYNPPPMNFNRYFQQFFRFFQSFSFGRR